MKTLKCFLLSFFVVTQLNAQINVGTDTIASQANMRIDILALATSSAYEKDFEKADRLLTGYSVDHIDINALRFHAQVLYWMKAFDSSISVYEKAIRLFPEPSSLHLDYARLLYNLGKLTKVRHLLETYRFYDSSNAEADIMTAYLDLWNGRIGPAEKKAGLLLQKYPGNAQAKDILSKVSQYTVPYIKTGTEFLADDQPLKGYGFRAEAGVYKSWLFAPTVDARIYQFKFLDSSFHSTWMQMANTVQLGINNKIKLQAGVFQQNGKGLDFTGTVEASRKITHNLLLQALLERRPNQYAAASIKSVVMEDVLALSVSYNRNDKWLGKAGYELLQYKDANKVHSGYLWILAPVVSVPRFSLSGGYAFRYADAAKNNFISKKPLSKLIETPFEGVPGVYSPYFTPENLMVHGALASVKIIALKKLEFISRFSIGLLAKADNPYLWLEKSGNNKYTIHKGFVEVDFMPITWVNELRFAISKKFSFAGNYTYDQLLYYKCHKGSIELKYLFLK